MTVEVRRLWAAFLAACSLCMLLWACGRGNQAPSVGSETNWLSCRTASDCDAETECQCGVCTLACEAAQECAGLAGAATCIEATSVSPDTCRLGFARSSQGLCVPGCRREQDCGPALACVQGVCLPRMADTPDGPVSEIAPDAGATTSFAVVAMGQTSPMPVEGAPADAGERGPAPDRLGGAVDALGQFSPLPKPECPCSADLGEAGISPKPGEAASNPYGGAMSGITPEALAETAFVSLPCNAETPPFGLFPDGFMLGPCTLFAMCSLGCNVDAACPNGGSGTAEPRCARTGRCYLDCADGRACPEGMTSVSGVDGAACYWPRDVLDPVCPGYCAARPAPRDCDNWCADLLVACDPEAGVDCCEGLSCTGGGYCDVL